MKHSHSRTNISSNRAVDTVISRQRRRVCVAQNACRRLMLSYAESKTLQSLNSQRHLFSPLHIFLRNWLLHRQCGTVAFRTEHASMTDCAVSIAIMFGSRARVE